MHDGRSLGAALAGQLATLGDERERAFVQACVYLTLRHVFSLEEWLTRLLARPLRRKDAEIEALLLAGLCQLRHMQVPAHAAVSASVEAVQELGRPWARGLVNGVLRAATRAPAPSPASETARTELPAWLIEALRADWPGDFEAIAAAGQAQAPMTLRVNRARGGPVDYAAALVASGLASRPTPHSPDGLILEHAVPVTDLPGFDAGLVSVQDEAAQLAASVLDCREGERVLDACAAPGGKTAHLLERARGALELTALDQSRERLADVAATLRRLGLEARLLQADAGTPGDWWDGRLFDRILLDAPCSSLGVLRRHPDIRVHRRASDLPAMAAAQQRLLAALWPLLRPGGRLLYATCSIMHAENEQVVGALLARRPDAAVVPLDGPWGRPAGPGRQILPGEEDMDGFYYALLEKRASAGDGAARAIPADRNA